MHFVLSSLQAIKYDVHCFDILMISTFIVIFRTQDENKDMDSQKYQFRFVELVDKKKGVSSSVARPMKKGTRGDANIGEDADDEDTKKKDDSQNPRDGRLNILSSTMPDLPTSTNIPTTPPAPRVLDSRRKVVKPVLKSSPGPLEYV